MTMKIPPIVFVCLLIILTYIIYLICDKMFVINLNMNLVQVDRNFLNYLNG